MLKQLCEESLLDFHFCELVCCNAVDMQVEFSARKMHLRATKRKTTGQVLLGVDGIRENFTAFFKRVDSWQPNVTGVGFGP